MRRARLLWLLGAVLLVESCSARARAEAAPDHFRSAQYYALNGGATALLFGGALTAELTFPDVCPGPDSCFFPGDRSVRQNHSRAARDWSDITASLSIVTPIAASVGQGSGARFANTELVYSQALAVDTFVHSVVKFSVRRPRPLSYRLAPGEHCATKDCYVSFYSGHTATAFTAAVAGSYLFAESARDRGSRYGMWGFELALASATANLRVRAGMHYYSDVLVGAIAGTSIGVLVPVLHGERYRPDAGELASASGGLVFGAILSQFLPTDAIARDLAQLNLTPLAVRGGSGLALQGEF
jgi:membrane-associated phospholipid phosphatase